MQQQCAQQHTEGHAYLHAIEPIHGSEQNPPPHGGVRSDRYNLATIGHAGEHLPHVFRLGEQLRVAQSEPESAHDQQAR